MNNQKVIGILLGLILMLFLLGINASDMGLPAFITSNRLGVLITICLYLFMSILIVKKMEFKFSSLLLSSLFFLISFWGLISLIISRYYIETSLVSVVTWLLIGITALLLSNIFAHINREVIETFLSFIIISGAIIVIFYFMFGYIKVGNLTESYMWTKRLNETSGGQSRIMNGLLVINILNVLVVSRIIKKGNFLFVISFSTLCIFIMFIIVSGSRQTLLAFLVATILTFFINFIFNEKERVKSTIKTIFASAFTIGLIILLLRYNNMFEWLQYRFLDQTKEFGNSDQSRYLVIKEALDYTVEYPFFGIGPGAFININTIGIHTHNGYANMLVHYGIIPALLLVILIICSLVIGFKKLEFSNKTKDYTMKSIYFFSIITVITFSTISFMFNDLIDEYFFWLLIILLLSLPINKKKEIVDRNEKN